VPPVRGSQWLICELTFPTDDRGTTAVLWNAPPLRSIHTAGSIFHPPRWRMSPPGA
jgi:hypothetical protein